MNIYKTLTVKIITIIFFMLFFNKVVRSQESVSTFNGIWNNKDDKSIFYLFNNGNYISVYFSKEQGILKGGFETGIYGFYSSNFDYFKYKKSNVGIAKIAKESDSLAIIDHSGFFLGYEFETGDRSLNLYNQNAFFFQKIYVLPQRIINQIRLIGAKKHIDVGKFLYSIETIGINKTVIYTLPDIKSKMYFLKGDKIKILEEKNDWLKFEYKGKKIINGWLKKKDLE